MARLIATMDAVDGAGLIVLAQSDEGEPLGGEPEGVEAPQIEGEEIQAVEQALHDEGAASTGFFEDTYTWTGLSLIILLLIVGRRGWATVTQMLDKRADTIRNELEEAQKLREEAQTALATYQRKQRDAMGEAEAIIAHARDEAERIRKDSMAAVEQTLERREGQAMDRIAQAEQQATAEVRGTAVDIAVAAAREVVAKQMSGKPASAMIDQSIADLSKRLH